MENIDGKYRVLRKLGEGFGGFVFLVEANGKQLALKQLKMRGDSQCLSSAEILDNFKQEFSTLKKLNHPHILRILDFGFDSQEGFNYFTTEYIQGQDLFEATRGMSPIEIEELIVQTLRALSYLHSQWSYHLDIKPANIMVTTDSKGAKVAKLIDFGLTAFRKKGVLAGSPAYLAPETLLGEVPDGRADLYSLGVTWYKCLKGENPFEMPDQAQTLTLQKIWMPPPVSFQSPDIPPYLDTILEKLLKKNPAERYHRADQVIRDINWSGFRHYPMETEATALAYLPGEGQLVGRQAEWGQLLSWFDRVFLTQSEKKVGVVLTGGAGTGKTRLLKEVKYHAQLQNVPVFNLDTDSPIDLKSDGLFLADNVGPESLKRAEQLLRQVTPHSVFILLAGRNLKHSPSMACKITLENFDRPTVADFVASVLGVNEPPEFLAGEIFSRTEGNPLFITELLQSLVQSHQIFDEQGRWSPLMLKEVGVDFNKLSFPKTLTEYCKKKYAHLPVGARKILAAVAVAKVPLDRILLAKLGYTLEKSDLEILQEENLVSVDPISCEIRLVNPSFRDWLCHDLDPMTLASLHQALGETFQATSHHEETAWFHLGFGLSDRQQRFKYLTQYGEALLKKTRWLEANRAFDAAAGIAPNQESRVDALLRKARAYFFAGQHGDALKLLEETQEILRKEKDNPQQWRWVQQTFRDMCFIYLKAGRLDLARESQQVSRVLLEDHDEDPVELMILDNFKASLLMHEGKLKEAAMICEETQRRWEIFDLETKKRVLNNELPNIYLAQKRAQEAKLLFQAAASFFQAIGNISKRAFSIHGWAESCCSLKQFDEATKIYQFCIDLSQELKNEELLLHAHIGLGNIDFYQKNWAACIEPYQKALELAQHQGNNDSIIAIEINLGIAFRYLKDINGAQLYLEHVVGVLEEQTSPSHRQLQLLTTAYLELGKVWEEKGQWIEARDAYRDTVRMARLYPSLERFRVPGGLALAKVALRLDRLKEAQIVLNDVEKGDLSAFQRKRLEESKKRLFLTVGEREPSGKIEKPLDSETVTISFKTYL